MKRPTQRQVQHRPRNEEASQAKEIGQLRQEVRLLKRQLAATRKQRDKAIQMQGDREAAAQTEVKPRSAVRGLPRPPSDPPVEDMRGSSCWKCWEFTVQEYVFIGKTYQICNACKARRVKPTL